MIKRLLNCLAMIIICISVITCSNAVTCAQDLISAAGNINDNAALDSSGIIVLYKQDCPARMAQSSNLHSSIKSRKYIAAHTELIQLENQADQETVINSLKNDVNVVSVEENCKRILHSVPNDTYYNRQWGLNRIQCETAWDMVPNTSQPVVVAVIDSGIDVSNPDLVNRIAQGGYNFYRGNTDVTDMIGHGTEVAGIIAAQSNNAIGISGVCGSSDVKILPLKTVDNDGYSYVADVIEAIEYAIEYNVDVINLSMGGPENSIAEKEAVQRAVQNGIVVVASAGNTGTGVYEYPASYDNVISVGSVASDDRVSSFSTCNDRIDVVAPGENIYSCALNNGYKAVSGTSFSAPLVSGIAAVIKGVNPSLAAADIESIICQTASDKGITGKDNYYGYGIVNFYEALKRPGTIPPEPEFDGYKWPEEKIARTADRDWTISFSCKLDEATVNQQNIYIIDSLGQPLVVTPTMSADGQSVIVHPQQPYQANQIYYLFISSNVRSSSGQSLQPAIRMKFTYQPAISN